MDANLESSGRADEEVWASKDGANKTLRGVVIGAINRGEMENTGMDPRWTLSGFRRESGTKVKAERFSATGVDGKKLFIYDRSIFQRSTVPGTRMRRWAVLHKLCAGTVIDARSANMPFICCEQELSYCRKLREAIDVKMEVIGRQCATISICFRSVVGATICTVPSFVD